MSVGGAIEIPRRGRFHAAARVAAAVILLAVTGTALLPVERARADNPGLYFLQPDADAYVHETLSTTNYGTGPYLHVGPAPEFGELRRIFLRFDPTVLPDDAWVGSATLNLYMHTVSEGGDVSLDVSYVTESWDEELITWDLQPAATFRSSTVISDTLGWKQFDVTKIVRAWADGSLEAHGLMISATDEDGANFSRGFHSREATTCTPYIDVSYTTEEVPPEPPALPPCGPGTDTEPPELTLRAEPDPAVAGETLTIYALAEDDDPDDTGVYRIQVFRGAELVSDDTFIGGVPRVEPAYIETPDPGVVRYSAIAWDMEMNAVSASMRLRVTMDGAPPSITVEHEPLNPGLGETVTFRARAVDPSGVDHIAISIGGVYQDFVIDPAETDREVTFDYSPGDSRVIRYFAYATDEEGFYNSTGTKYVLLGDLTGPDSDGDHVSDEIEAVLGTDAGNDDTDGDGLYDGWEILGFDRGWDGTVEVDLPMLGASPYHRDVFVEMDWMESATFSYQLHPEGIQAVVNTLADYGLRLHVDTGQLGGGNALPWESSIGDQWGWMNDTKRANFDEDRLGLFYYVAVTPHVGAKTNCATVGGREFCRSNMFVTRRSTGGYATPARNAELFIHELGHAIGLGHGGQREVTPYTVYGLGPDGVVTTFSLDWALDQENDKPHYLSNMNYRYQFQLKVRTDDGEDVYLYGYHVAPSLVLDETALDEAAGMEVDADFGRYVWRRCVTAEECADEWHLFHSWLEGTYYLRPHRAYELPLPDPAVDDTCPVYTEWFLGDGSSIDWDLDGVVDPAPLEWDVDQRCSCRGGGTDCDCECEWTTSSDLVAPFEPPLLEPKIYGRESDFSFSATDAIPANDRDLETNSPEPNEPPPLATDGEHCDNRDNDGDGLIDEGCGDADGDQIADIIDNCPLTANPQQTDSNGNYVGDACEGPPDAPTGLTVRIENGAPLLEWNVASEANVVGYNVYRRTGTGTGFDRRGTAFPTTLKATFTDGRCVDGATYAVSAVNLNLKESAPSETVTLGGDVCPLPQVYLPLVLKGK